MLKKNIKWQNPVNFAQKISDNYGDESWIFLYSGLNDVVKKSTSYIALFPKKEIVAESFKDAEKLLNNSQEKCQEKWFGYLSYELAQDLEKLPKTTKSPINLPKIWLINFAVILQFNHDKKILTAFFDDDKNLTKALKYKAKPQQAFKVKVKNIASNFSNQSYLNEIDNIKNMIKKGDFYQTNLTRKFFGKLDIKESSRSYFSMFKKLCKLSPANYSAFLSFKKHYIISASPELFLTINDKKIIKSRPIKGTAPRSSNLKEDQKNKNYLKNSSKERAENLMIVDLVRNDLARVCKAGSVKVDKLFNITSYKTIHHMSSEISGQVADNFSALDAVQSCFPAGSMTGAPKIKAMEVAAKKEQLNRGVYSGAIGFFEGANQANFSVVIRTLICHQNNFEFQVGGAITFDSEKNAELAEIFNKAKAILKLLEVTKIRL